jgi:hypothetical protein
VDSVCPAENRPAAHVVPIIRHRDADQAATWSKPALAELTP